MFDSIDSSLGQFLHLHDQTFSSESSSLQFCLVEDKEVSSGLSKQVDRMGILPMRQHQQLDFISHHFKHFNIYIYSVFICIHVCHMRQVYLDLPLQCYDFCNAMILGRAVCLQGNHHDKISGNRLVVGEDGWLKWLKWVNCILLHADSIQFYLCILL